MAAPALKLAGKVALVTGGGGAIGGAICEELDREAAAVVVADVREDAAAVAGRLERGTPAALDVSDRAAWDALVERVVVEYGALDLLVNNAATHVQSEYPDDPGAKSRWVLYRDPREIPEEASYEWVGKRKPSAGELEAIWARLRAGES